MVVLAGYKTVKQALVQHADVFGHRDPGLLMQESHKGHGKQGRVQCARARLWAAHLPYLHPAVAAGACPSWEGARGGRPPGRVASLSEGCAHLVRVNQTHQYRFNNSAPAGRDNLCSASRHICSRTVDLWVDGGSSSRWCHIHPLNPSFSQASFGPTGTRGGA